MNSVYIVVNGHLPPIDPCYPDTNQRIGIGADIRSAGSWTPIIHHNIYMGTAENNIDYSVVNNLMLRI